MGKQDTSIATAVIVILVILIHPESSSSQSEGYPPLRASSQGPHQPYLRTVSRPQQFLRPSNIPTCTSHSHDEPAGANFTIVTALYDLHRENWPHFKRRFETYLSYSFNLLNLDAPIVFYIDQKTQAFVEYFRQDKRDLTHLKVGPLQDLAYYKEYHDWVARVMQSEDFHKDNLLLTHPEGFSPDYNVLMNAKFTMLHDTVRENPFNTSYFYWLDMGYGHGQDNVYPKYCGWAPNNIMKGPDKVTYIAVNNVSEVQSVYQLYKQRVGPGVSGGFFGGSKKAVGDYYELHKSVFEEFLHRNMVDDDQTIAIECWLRQPDLFNMVLGGWYDLFYRFR